MISSTITGTGSYIPEIKKEMITKGNIEVPKKTQIISPKIKRTITKTQIVSTKTAAIKRTPPPRSKAKKKMSSGDRFSLVALISKTTNSSACFSLNILTAFIGSPTYFGFLNCKPMCVIENHLNLNFKPCPV